MTLAGHSWLRTRYLLKRLAGTVLTLLLLAVTVFILVKLIPGDEARVAAGPEATPAEVAAVRLRLGLDRPLTRQFVSFLARLAHGDLGTSSATNTSVASGIVRVLPETIELVVLAVTLIVVLAVPAALVSAMRSGHQFDRVVSTVVVFGAGLPAFWVALLAQFWLGSRLHLLPISGELSSSFSVPTRTGFVLVDTLLAGNVSAFFDALGHLFLPASVLAVSFGAQFYRALRAEMVQVLDRDFVMLARAKGVTEWRLAVHHLLPNAAGPALTVLGILFGNMVGGAILVESVFGLPGIGAYLVNAVAQKDIFAVLGGVLVIGVVVILANLIVDILQLVRDPRWSAAPSSGSDAVALQDTSGVSFRLPVPGRVRRSGWFNRVVVAALIVIVVVAIVGPLVVPSSVTTSNILHAFAPPSAHHWFGTDEQGRDVFWRVVAGARYSVLSSVVVVAGYSTIGVIIAVAATAGGRFVDQALMRVTDAGLALPTIIFALALAAVLGDGLRSSIIALIVTGWPFTARLLRTVMRETMETPFVEGALVLGVSRRRLLFRHVLPNSLDVLIVKWAADVGNAVLALSSLSFIGVGAQPPSPEWGAMINDAASYVSRAWWAALAPGVAIALAATTFALLGDMLQVRLNPALREGRARGPAGPGTAAAVALMAARAPLLSITQLAIVAPRTPTPVTLVEGFDLDITTGERVGLVGETGSGKTVVARSIMRLTPSLQVTGSVRFKSTELLGLGEGDMRQMRGRQIAMVFQDPLGALNPLMTVGAQIAEPLRMAGVAKKTALARAAAVLSDLGIVNAAARLSAYPHEFSGGMRQRVALAIALVGEPALLIADEPTTALDVRVQEQVLDLIDRVALERGLAVLMITHDLAAVAGFCDRVAVMYAGQKVHEDNVERLFASPAHPYTAALLDAVPRLDCPDKLLWPILGAPPHPAERPSGCPFHPRCPFAGDICKTTRPPALLLPTGGTVACLKPLVPVLEGQR